MHKSPFFRLVSVTVLVVGIVLISLMFLRYVGSEQRFAPTPHPWMDKKHWLVARLSPQDCSQMALEQMLELGPEWMIWVDVQPDDQLELHTVCPESKLFEVKSPAKRGPKLTQILPLIKDRDVIFNLRATDVSAGTPFLKLLDGWQDQKHIGIASASQGLLRDLRKKRAEWLFAADASTWTKLKFFEAFGIEAAVDLWPDFFVASQDNNEPNFFDHKAAHEIDRRKKVLLLELNNDDVDPSVREELRGVLTTRPKNFSADTFFKKIGAE